MTRPVSQFCESELWILVFPLGGASVAYRARHVTMAPEQHIQPCDLRIYLLGGFRVFVGEREMTSLVYKRRPASLLKLLALTPGHALHREIVQDRLWPD